MNRALATCVLVVMLLLMGSCGSSNDLSRATTQEDFGVRMASMNLWREALFRFKRAVELDPNDAEAHSNLAVAYEANGDFDSAAKEYREAMRLDRTNQYIQKNYSRFVEFTQRNRKRQQRREAPRTAATGGVMMPDPEPLPPSTTTGEPAAQPASNPPQPEPTPPKSPDGGF